MESHKPKLINVASHTLLFLVFLCPVFFLPASFISPQFATGLLFVSSLILSGTFFLVEMVISGAVRLPERLVFFLVAVFGFPATYFLSSLLNNITYTKFFGYSFDIYSLAFVLYSFTLLSLVAVTFRETKKIFYSYFAFIVSALVLASFILSRLVWGTKLLSFGVFNSITSTPLGTWNNVGIFFGLSVVLCLITFEFAPVSKFLKFILTISVWTSLFILALVNFDSVWIVLAAVSFLVIIFGVFSAMGKESGFIIKIRKTPILASMVFVCAIFFVFFGKTYGEYLPSKLNVVNIEVRPSFATTFEIAQHIFKANPFFGSGPNSFLNKWLLLKPRDVLSTVFWNIDFSYGTGIIPTYLATNGVMGVVSWALFIIYYLYAGVKSLFGKSDDKFIKYILVSSFFTSLYLWLMSTVFVVSVSIYILTFYFTGLFFAAASISGGLQSKEFHFIKSSKRGFFVSLISVSVVASFIMVGYVMLKQTKSMWFYEKSSKAINLEKNNELSEKYMLKAIDLIPHDIYYRALSEIELSKLKSIASQDTKSVKSEDIQKQFTAALSDAIRAGTKAKDIDPENYLNWLSLGRVYESVSSPNLKIKGSYDAAISSYEEALKRNPNNPAILIALSKLAASHDDLINAKEYAIRAIQLKANYLDAYFILSQIEVAGGNTQGAIDAVVASISIDGKNPALYFQLGLLQYYKLNWYGAIDAFEKAVSLANDYANARYFLGLSYERVGLHDKAISEFQDIKKTNPDNKEVDVILTNLVQGKSIFTNIEKTKSEKIKTLPIRE